MSSITCPNCGEHDLQLVTKRYVHRECTPAPTGKTEWEAEVPAAAGNDCQPCPTCGKTCTPTKVVCPKCSQPIEDPGEN